VISLGKEGRSGYGKKAGGPKSQYRPEDLKQRAAKGEGREAPEDKVKNP